MDTFLGHIAEGILREYGNSLYRHTMVFPSRRAGLYFNLCLAEKAGKPVWSPVITTINELAASFSELIIAENERLIFELYKIYRQLNKKAESFDSFYFWGDMLLNDFDNIDKYLVDPERIFYNLRDLKEIDSRFGILTEEQIDVIKKFWINFNPDSGTGEKEGFLEIWNILPDLYTGFRESLRKQGLAYEGMVLKELALKCNSGETPVLKGDLFHFIGLNAVNRCERVFLKTLSKSGVARFYWDYDNSFVTIDKEHPAGYFIRQNLKEFGNDMPPGWDYSSRNFSVNRKASWSLIETSSETSQVKTVSQLIADHPEYLHKEAHHSAIVLADENLLVPLLTSLPNEATAVNITMGYPLKFNQVYTLVRHLSGLQKNSFRENGMVYFDITDIRNIAGHGLLKRLFPGTDSLQAITEGKKNSIPENMFEENTLPGLVFRKYEFPGDINSWIARILKEAMNVSYDEQIAERNRSNFTDEFIFRTILVLNRLQGIISNAGFEFSGDTYFRLLDKLLRNLSVPFTGEPLSGLQVMGILETRALDFKNLYILSVNEGVLPRTAAGASYIPHNLREAFGLPTIRHQDSIYAYYFYRLLQRADNVTFIYNSSSEGLRTGEMSRFLHQLSFLNQSPPEFKSVSYDVNVAVAPSAVVVRTREHLRQLENRYLGENRKMLTPGAVNTWLSCRMKFYYRYVAGIREPEISPDEIDPALFGDILHSVMENIYSGFNGSEIRPPEIADIESDALRIESLVFNAINNKLYNGNLSVLSGNDHIVKNILLKYIHSVLRFDKAQAPFIVTGLEKELRAEMAIRYAGADASVITGGIIDRTDILEGVTRVVDYKTGKITGEIRSVASLFDPEDDNRSEAWLQVLMYCEIIMLSGFTDKVRPSVYAVRNLMKKDFSDKLLIKPKGDDPILLNDYNSIRPEFSTLLRETVESIFSADQNFRMTDNRQKCRYCPYKKLCRR